MLREHRLLPFAAAVAAVALAAAACGPTGAASTPTAGPAATPVVTPVVTPIPTPTPEPTFDYSGIDFTPGTVATPRQIDVSADEALHFTPGVIIVVQGETVTFNVTTSGKTAHEFMIGPADAAFADKEGTPEVQDLVKGKTQSLTFTFDGPGPYAFACHEPGHFEAGMKGWIIVVGPDVPKVGTKENPRLVHLDMTDKLAFTPSDVPVAPGETVRFLLTNSGTVEHEFALGPKDKVDADEIDGVIVVEAEGIAAGMTADVVYTFAGAGPFGFACHEPSHFEAGMLGTVTLTP